MSPWIDMTRVAVAPTLTDDDLKVRVHEKIDDDEGEGPRPVRHRPQIGEKVSKITLAVRRHRAKAMAEGRRRSMVAADQG
jgi:hypothetical protein